MNKIMSPENLEEDINKEKKNNKLKTLKLYLLKWLMFLILAILFLVGILVAIGGVSFETIFSIFDPCRKFNIEQCGQNKDNCIARWKSSGWTNEEGDHFDGYKFIDCVTKRSDTPDGNDESYEYYYSNDRF